MKVRDFFLAPAVPHGHGWTRFLLGFLIALFSYIVGCVLIYANVRFGRGRTYIEMVEWSASMVSLIVGFGAHYCFRYYAATAMLMGIGALIVAMGPHIYGVAPLSSVSMTIVGYLIMVRTASEGPEKKK